MMENWLLPVQYLEGKIGGMVEAENDKCHE